MSGRGVHDRLVPGGPSPSVDHALLEEGEEGLHGRVVPGWADLAHRADQPMTGERVLKKARSELRALVRVHQAPGHHGCTAARVTALSAQG